MSDPQPPPPAATVAPGAWKHRLLNAAAVLAIVALLSGAALWLLNAFHDRGYAPDQPIAFSHKQHAGDLKMDCRSCHFNAERGKHAGVPPMSVCIGCHSQVAADRPEIQKLAAIAQGGSYTGADGTIHEGGVVHWARVHKLPDHVYFDHSKHVQANVACQTCHGPVETMPVVRQYATMTMGWCLGCHRQDTYVGKGTKGSAGPAVLRERERRDPLVVFRERAVKGAGDGSHAAPAPRTDVRALPLPKTHAGLVNATTDCSTCHQ